MKTARGLLVVILVLTLFPERSLAQKSGPVMWNWKAERISADEIMVCITAVIAPEWHLYSQHLKEGGPHPTRFEFQKTDVYTPVGRTVENGKQTKFYEEIYEMEITWYSGTVSFLQRFRLDGPVESIKGSVEYMTCNDQLCVPDKRDFEIMINLQGIDNK